MAKEIKETTPEVLTVPQDTFEVENLGSFKFNVARFVMTTKDGKGEAKVVLAKDALKDAEILAELVKIGAGVITQIES